MNNIPKLKWVALVLVVRREQFRIQGASPASIPGAIHEVILGYSKMRVISFPSLNQSFHNRSKLFYIDHC